MTKGEFLIAKDIIKVLSNLSEQERERFLLVLQGAVAMATAIKTRPQEKPRGGIGEGTASPLAPASSPGGGSKLCS